MAEWYRKLRPRNFTQVFGQEDAVKTLMGYLAKGELPHAVMFSGPPGTGKTTLARICAKQLGAFNDWKDISRSMDFTEKNCANFRGIDDVRDILQHCSLAPVNGKCRVWVLDECQQLTGPAQSILLKVLEEAPETAYFFLCTSIAKKLQRAVITRCCLINMKTCSDSALRATLLNILERAKEPVPSDAVLNKVISVSDGSPRYAIQTLQRALQLQGEAAQLDAISREAGQTTGVEIARLLMKGGPGDWVKVAALIRDCEEDFNDVRLSILGYATAVMLNQPKPGRANFIVNAFIEPFYEMPKAAVARAAYETLSQ